MQNLILIWGIVNSFLFPNLANIKSNDNNINVLIMGKAGGAHDGPDLTDTMILATVNTTNKNISTVSIPRDLWIPDLKTKINSTYYYGKNDLAKKTVGQIFDTDVPYSVLIDFSGFKNIIDAVGGIDVNVENSFTDKLYPIAGKENDKCITCRYETITFEKGNQKMDGDTALKFVRSRHSVGDEGTDIAREARQQKVIDALKNKLTNPKTFINIKNDVAIFNAVKDSIQIDFDEKTAAVIARKVFDARNVVKNYTIPDTLLIYPKNNLKPYDNQYVFIPSLGNGKWQDLQKWFKSLPN